MPTDPFINIFFSKESHFDHESEFRVVTYKVKNDSENHFGSNNLLPNESGIIVLIDVDSLIQEIVVSPYAPEWFYGLVLQVNNTYKLSAPVAWSSVKLR